MKYQTIGERNAQQQKPAATKTATAAARGTVAAKATAGAKTTAGARATAGATVAVAVATAAAAAVNANVNNRKKLTSVQQFASFRCRTEVDQMDQMAQMEIAVEIMEPPVQLRALHQTHQVLLAHRVRLALLAPLAQLVAMQAVPPVQRPARHQLVCI